MGEDGDVFISLGDCGWGKARPADRGRAGTVWKGDNGVGIPGLREQYVLHKYTK